MFDFLKNFLQRQSHRLWTNQFISTFPIIFSPLFFLYFPFSFLSLPSLLLSSLSLSFFYYTRISLSHTWWEQVGKVWVSYYSVWCQLCIFCSYSLLVLRKLSSILLSFFLMNYFHLHHFFFYSSVDIITWLSFSSLLLW